MSSSAPMKQNEFASKNRGNDKNLKEMPAGMSAEAPGKPAPSQLILQVGTGYMASMCLFIAAKLKIADLLADEPKSVYELASVTGMHEDRLYRVLRSLAMVGIFSEVGARKFALTPPAATLRTDVPESVHALVLWLCDPFHFTTFAELPHSVETGETTFDHIYGKSVFEYFPEDPVEEERFNNAMTCLSNMMVPAVLEAYDFSSIGTLLDVAGGHGALLCAILERYPKMRGMLVDLPSVLEGTHKAVSARGLKDRCHIAYGDFFASIPGGADAIIMKHIIHDWDDDKAIAILTNCRQSLAGKPNARVILVESVLPEGNEPHMGKLIDLEMMVYPGGRERTEAEFCSLFEKAGLRLNRVIPTNAPLVVVEAVLG
jgi:hypothetical protein